MPSVNASGEIFSLSGDVRFEGPVAFRAGIGGQLSVALEAEACHGLSLEAGARAIVEANAALSFLLSVRGTGFATAAAGVAARAQFKPDAFDRLGLLAQVAAYAEASAGGRLAIGLDFNALALWGRDNLQGVTLEIFLAFLREIVLEAGVWGRASAAAMAQAHAEITLSLEEGENSGFIIEAGASLGWGAGTGWDFYAAAAFTDVRRFYATAVGLITKEIVTQARRALPAEYRVGVELIELLLPTALNTAFELGQKAALETLAPPDEMAEIFLRSVGNALRDFLFNKIKELSETLLLELLDGMRLALGNGDLPEERAEQVTEAVEALIAYVREREEQEIRLEDLPDLGGLLLDVVAASMPEYLDAWKENIALGWTALACAGVLRDFVPVASGSGSLVGLGTDELAADLPDLPSAPAIVREVYAQALGREIDIITFRDAVDFVVASSVGELILDYTPAAGAVLGQLSEEFGITAGDVLESAVRFSLGQNLTTLTVYQKLRDYAKTKLDGSIRQEIFPLLKQSLGTEGREYIKEVAEPSLAALSEFVFDKLDAVVSGVGADEEGPFMEKLSAGCSTVVYQIVARNVLFVEQILFEHVLDSLSQAFGQLAVLVRSDPDHIMTRTLRTLLPTSNPAIPLLAGNDLAALQEFIAELALIGRDAYGPEVWTTQRRRRLKELKRQIVLGFEGENPFRDASAAEDFVRELILCDYVPSEAGLSELAGLSGEILVDEAAIIVPRGADALSFFLLRLGEGIVREIDRRAREFLNGLAELIDAALHEIDRWRRELRAAIDALELKARAFGDALQALADTLRDTGQRQTIKDSLYGLGARRVEAGVRALDGDPDSVAFGENEAVGVALGLYSGAFFLATPLIDLAIDGAAAVADTVGDLIEDAVDAADALEAILDETVGAAIDAVTRGIESLGIDLPDQLAAQDIADAIANALPTGFLLGLIDAVLAAREGRQAAEADRNHAQSELDGAKADHRRRAADYQGAIGKGPLRIQILSPVRMPRRLEDLWCYGPIVPVYVRLRGVTLSFFKRGPQRRARLALNGRELAYRANQWHAGPADSFEFQRALTFGSDFLIAGINVFEVSVVDGQGKILREAVPFVVNPNALNLVGEIKVAPELSRFDVPGDDHERTRDEKVVFQWFGRKPLSLERWRVIDRDVKHIYRFGARRLNSGGTLTLATGGDPREDNDRAVFWGRNRAVWNNTGDTVCVVDDRGILRAAYVYDPEVNSG